MKQVIYETKGRAREFNELAINLYAGCGHRCIYCYGADVTRVTREQFTQPHPRVTVEDIETSAWLWEKMYAGRRILLCFITDPYQPLDEQTKLTRSAIEVLHKHKMSVMILTKGGMRSIRDFDLLTSKDAYATTLTLDNTKDSLIWEPGAAIPDERIAALKMAHDAGIETWVSFEPIIFPKQTFHLLDMTHEFVGHYKVGTMNYHSQGKKTDWFMFGWDMKKKMDEMGVKYYFKKDLLREMHSDMALKAFKQTWVCH